MENLMVKNLNVIEKPRENSVKNQTNINGTNKTRCIGFLGKPNQDNNIEFALSATKDHEKKIKLMQ